MRLAEMTQGDSAQADSWVDEHGDYLYRFALMRVRDPEAAQDLVQETFVAAIRASDRFQGTSSLRSWLAGILKHKIIDYFRERARTVLAADLERDGEREGE